MKLDPNKVYIVTWNDPAIHLGEKLFAKGLVKRQCVGKVVKKGNLVAIISDWICDKEDEDIDYTILHKCLIEDISLAN